MERSKKGILGAGLLLAGTVVPSAAHAVATLPTVPTGAMHVGKRALDVVGGIALKKVPTHFEVPPIDKDLISCPIGGPIQLHVSQGYVDLVPKSLTFEPANGSVNLNTLLDLTGFVHVTITKGYACVGTASCDVAFRATDLNPKARLELSVDNGKPKAGVGAVSVSAGDLHVDIENCALENLSSGVVDSIAEKMLEMSGGMIGDKLRGIVPPLVEAQLTSVLTQSGSFSGYGFNAAIKDVQLTADGIDAYAEIGVAYEGVNAACLADAPTSEISTPRNPTSAAGKLLLPTGPTSPVLIGISSALLSNAVSAAWRAGLMCTDDAAVRALGFDPSKLASLVPGLPPGTVLGFTLGLNAAPTVTTEKNGSIGMHVKGAELILSMASPGRDTANITVVSDFTVGVKPTVDPNTGTIYASLSDLSMERMEMSADATGADYSVDPERLQVLMHDVVLPMASARMRTMPLSPSSFGAAGMYAWLDDLYTNSSGIYIGVEPFVPAPAEQDTSTPDTTLEKNPGRLVRAGMARYTVGGTDDKTPYQLLRYEWQVDDGPVHPATFAKVINAAVTTAGSHTFRVRSVDLTDKHADKWVQHTFELDPVAPTLNVTEQPEVTVRARSTKIVLTGTDDRSKPNLLSYSYRVLARAPGGEQTLVETGEPTGLDNGVGEIVVHDLEEDSVYEVTVLLYDEAGNVTSKKIGFAAASVNGCSVSGADGSSLASLMLIGAALFMATRRRRLSR